MHKSARTTPVPILLVDPFRVGQTRHHSSSRPCRTWQLKACPDSWLGLHSTTGFCSLLYTSLSCQLQIACYSTSCVWMPKNWGWRWCKLRFEHCISSHEYLWQGIELIGRHVGPRGCIPCLSFDLETHLLKSFDSVQFPNTAAFFREWMMAFSPPHVQHIQ